MVSLGVSSSQISAVIDDPTALYPLLSPNASSTSSPFANISPSTASQILSGYTHGVRSVFLLNACLAALCVLVAYVMIHHKELIRADEVEMRKRAKAQFEGKHASAKTCDNVKAGGFTGVKKLSSGTDSVDQAGPLQNNTWGSEMELKVTMTGAP